MRSLNPTELSLLEKLLERSAPGSSELRAQIAGALVRAINDDGTILRFELRPSALRAPTGPLHFVPVEASALDTDGTVVRVLLHVRNGLLYEIEYVREAPGKLEKFPSAQDLFDFRVVQGR